MWSKSMPCWFSLLWVRKLLSRRSWQQVNRALEVRSWVPNHDCSCKVFALQMLYLDADNTPLQDPSKFFEWPEFKKHGNVFWPDYMGSGRYEVGLISMIQIFCSFHQTTDIHYNRSSDSCYNNIIHTLLWLGGCIKVLYIASRWVVCVFVLHS